MVRINQPLIVAHRGASGVVPENTMLAISLACIEAADIIEIDVQLTRDHEVVLFHDRDLSRIVGNPKNIGHLTLNEIKQLDVGSWKHSKFDYLRIPLLEEVLQFRSDSPLIIEIKPSHNNSNRVLEQKVLNLVEEYGQYSPGYISVRDEATYDWFVDHSNLRVTLMQKSRAVPELIEIIESHGVNIIQTRASTCTSEDYHYFKNMGIENYVYYADSPEDWLYFTKQPIQGVLTNFPGVMRAYYTTIC